MTNVSLENIKGNAIGGIIAAIIMTAVPIGKLSEFVGQAAAALFLVIGAAGFWVLVLVYHRYVLILGAGGSRKETPGKQAYDNLRANLERGGPVGRLYSYRLQKLLDATDKFFGDTAPQNKNLSHSLFRLKTPVPTWTASSFDKCILLAMAYPLATVFFVWTVTGHVGPAERSLLLNESVEWWRRVFTALAILLAIVAGLAGQREEWTPGQTALLVVAFCLSIACALAGTGSFGGYVFQSPVFAGAVVAFVVMIIVLFTEFGGLSGTTGLSVGLLMTLGVGYSANLRGFVSSSCLPMLALVVALPWITKTRIWSTQVHFFLVLFMVAMTAVCVVEAYRLAPTTLSNHHGESLLMFLVLFTILNAPFDWFSLGLTRGLLRRGLELGGWWPFFLAIADAVAATAVVTLLALTMVIGVEVFGRIIVHGGGIPTFSFEAMMSGLRERPTEPEYWWIYSLLFSTMIPSLINLAIGGASLMRGVPGVSSWLRSKMPDKRSVPKLDRNLIALVLTGQIAVGILLGALAQGALVWFLFFKAMPLVGTNLLNIADQVVAFDFPSRIDAFFRTFLQ